MVKVKDINYVAYLKVSKGINFDTVEKVIINNRKNQTQFVYNDMITEEYFKYIADYNKSDISIFMNVIRELKTIVHLDNEY